MDKAVLKKWAQNLGLAWEKRDALAAATLFAKNVQYYESVFSSPCKNWNVVYELWKAVPQNQKEVCFSLQQVLVNERTGIVHWNLSRILLPSNQKQKIDGIFMIKLNSKGLCTFFKQWRAVKEYFL